MILYDEDRDKLLNGIEEARREALALSDLMVPLLARIAAFDTKLASIQEVAKRADVKRD